MPSPTTTYKPEYCEQVRDMFRGGLSVFEIVRALGVARSTFYYWAEQNPEFKEVITVGHEHARGWWEEQARNNLVSAKDYPFNPTLWMMAMRSRFKGSDGGLNKIKVDENATASEKAHALFNSILAGENAEGPVNVALSALKTAVDIQTNTDLQKRIEALEAKSDG